MIVECRLHVEASTTASYVFLLRHSCVLKVNIHCDGCEQKVKKLLQKIDGVYSVKVDADEGTVVVTGDVDPAKVVKKLKRAGKHAEIWGGGQKGIMYNQNYPINPQFQNNKSQNHKGQIGQLSHFQNTKGAKDLKEHKSIKFNLPEEEFDASDEEEEEEEEEEGLIGNGHPMHHNKMMPMMGDVHGNNGSAKKGYVIDQSMKMKGNENGGKKSNQKGENKKPKGSGGGDDNKKKKGKSVGGLLGRFLGFGKKNKKLELQEATYTDKSKKGGGNNNKGKLEDHSKNEFLFHDYDDNTPPHKKNGKSGKGKEGQMGPGPIKCNYPMENIPAMNGDGGYYQGMQMQHAPYNNNFQQANMNMMYPTAMMYGMLHPSINYMPPPPMPSHPMVDPITHSFSDENVESCSIIV
ncbi:Heavy metal-associated isoprenylated plant protein 33, partial [Mucuna pruriens]